MVMLSQVFVCSQGVCRATMSWEGRPSMQTPPLQTDPPTPRYGQPAGGTHPTEMHTWSFIKPQSVITYIAVR